MIGIDSFYGDLGSSERQVAIYLRELDLWVYEFPPRARKFVVPFFGLILIFIILLCTFIQISVIGLPDQSVLTIKDENFEVFIDFDGINIREAAEESNAILLDPDVDVLARLEYLVVGNYSIEVDKLKTVFSLADFDAWSKIDRLDFTLYPGGNFTFVQTWKFKNYIGSRNIGIVSGIYQVRYDLYYRVEGYSKVIKSVPFYVRFSGNPITSVFGVAATVGVAHAGISILGLVNSMRKSIQLEVDRSIESTKVSPTKKLMGYYKGKSYKSVQDEVSNVAFRYATKLWRGDKCPQCGTDWPEGHKACPSCHLTLEEAQELYSKLLRDKSLNACREVVDSVSGLSLSSIANNLGEGVTPTTDIISVLTFSGLALVQPRVAKSWGKKTGSLVFTGLRTTVFSLFWVQACGVEEISLTMLVIAVISGTLLPMLIGKVLGNNIKEKAKIFWESKQSSMRTKP